MPHYKNTFRESELVEAFVDSFLTTAADAFKKLRWGTLVDGKPPEFPKQGEQTGQEIERIRDDWRLRRRNDELS